MRRGKWCASSWRKPATFSWYGVAKSESRKKAAPVAETLLYGPVKRFIEGLGFSAKGEIGGCDLLALSPHAPPIAVVCELKREFNLELVLQAVDRASISDEVWLAARMSKRGKGREHDARFRNLCRRLGFGLLGVSSDDQVHVLLSPAAPAPRRDPKRRSRLIEEHRRRHGDPALGGGSRLPIMTAYRQEALACAAAMLDGPKRPRDLKHAMPNAAKILFRNVYGWFRRTEHGVYAVTEAGRAAVLRWPPPSARSGGSEKAIPRDRSARDGRLPS
jgi:hypothetical protein